LYLLRDLNYRTLADRGKFVKKNLFQQGKTTFISFVTFLQQTVGSTQLNSFGLLNPIVDGRFLMGLTRGFDTLYKGKEDKQNFT
tara:strand:+ start:1142 stop:1393 length:252 start_codon:yes stop_codon:yes gene_type:complete